MIVVPPPGLAEMLPETAYEWAIGTLAALSLIMGVACLIMWAAQ